MTLSRGRSSWGARSTPGQQISKSYIAPLFFKMACKQNLDLRCVLISDPSTLGAGAKTRLHTPKAVTYHEQPHYCRFMIGHSLGRMESRIKKFTPHCVCRPSSSPRPVILARRWLNTAPLWAPHMPTALAYVTLHMPTGLCVDPICRRLWLGPLICPRAFRYPPYCHGAYALGPPYAQGCDLS